MIVPSYHYLVGPLVAFGALFVIILICRWVFSTASRDDRTAQRLEKARSAGDYGLLVSVARVRTTDDADMLRGVLRDAGIRCTVAPPQQGAQQDGTELLVFRADAGRARDLVSSQLPPA